MDSTKTFFNNFFVTLGVLFVLILIALAYFFITDPYNLKPMLFGSPAATQTQKTAPPVETQSNASSTPIEADSTFILSDAQKQALINLGIDPATVPTTINPVQVLCFEEKLGAPRVAEIRTGSVPTTFELLKVKSCVGQ